MRQSFVISTALVLVTSIAPQGVAQSLAIPSDNPRLRAALDMIKAQEPWTLDQQVSICEIPAPPYKEATRAAEYRRRWESHVHWTRLSGSGSQGAS